jgi:hypothetical protein
MLSVLDHSKKDFSLRRNARVSSRPVSNGLPNLDADKKRLP